jgi:hypothetical protein
VNPKRIAGVINIIAAVAFLVVGLTRHPVRKFFLVIAAFFLIIGYLRLKKSPPGPPTL